MMDENDLEIQLTPTFRRKETLSFLKFLHPKSKCIEIRALGKRNTSDFNERKTEVGFFDDLDLALKAIQKYHGSKQVCIGLNPRTPELFHSAPKNEMGLFEGGKEEDISSINWAFIDIDPKRKPNVSASDEELKLAEEVCKKIETYFRKKKIPFVKGLSGNGYHLLVRIKKTKTNDLKVLLSWLNRRFGTDKVDVDQSTYDKGRLIKVYGTVAMKGQNTKGRPWRLAKMIETQMSLRATNLSKVLKNEIMEELVDVGESQNSETTDPIISVFKEKGLLIKTNGSKVLVKCPWREEHTSGEDGDSSTVLIKSPGRGVGFKCQHNHCSRRTIQDVKNHFRDELSRFCRTKYEALCITTAIEKYQKTEPDPIRKEARIGLMGKTLKLIEPVTEAAPEAIIAQLLIGIGNLVGNKRSFMVEATYHHTNIYGLIVGDTSKARKGTSWNHAKRAFQFVDPEWSESKILNALTSGEGLIEKIKDQIMKLKDDGEEYISDPGVSDKRLLVVVSEFGSVLKQIRREGNVLSPVLRSAWDSENLVLPNKNSPIKASNPHVSLIGHITKDEFTKSLNDVELANGLMNRILMFYSKRSKLLPRGGLICEDQLEEIVDDWRKVADFANENPGAVDFDTEASELWSEIYAQLSEAKPGLFGMAVARSEAQVIRLALIYSVIERSEKIMSEHLIAALAVWQYCERTCYFIFGDRTTDAFQEELADLILTHPDGVTRTQIRDHFRRNKSKSLVDRTLSNLLRARRIKCEKQTTGGRPVEIWLPVHDKNDKSPLVCTEYVEFAQKALQKIRNSKDHREKNGSRLKRKKKSSKKSRASEVKNTAGQMPKKRDNLDEPTVVH